MELVARNTNQLAPRTYRLLKSVGHREESRNGAVLRFADPVTLCLTHPQERVNFCPVRDANPFFHFMEAMAMLAPYNSVSFLSHFAKNIATFSDNGATFNAFYGTRARHHWSSGLRQDQLSAAIQELRERPFSRQAVVLLWDPADYLKETKDKACNLLMIFSRTVDGRLRMTTANRSNDCVWGGVSGANIVHFSYFQEYVASALGWPMGDWWHTSNNLHAYVDSMSATKWQEVSDFASGVGDDSKDPYAYRELDRPLMFLPSERTLFDEILLEFLQAATNQITDGKFGGLTARFGAPYVDTVARPMFNAWQFYKAKNMQMALHHTDAIADGAWRLACHHWLMRRSSKAL